MSVEDYLKADRQWPRVHRIAHARFRLRASKTEAERKFWTAVLEANQGD